MKTFFAPNIGKTGRVMRGLSGAALVAGAVAAWWLHWLAALVLFISGLFVLYESLRGWCLLRACGLRTRF